MQRRQPHKTVEACKYALSPLETMGTLSVRGTRGLATGHGVRTERGLVM
jgi:hypothetical protein